MIIFWIEAIFFFYSFFLDNNVFVSIEYKKQRYGLLFLQSEKNVQFLQIECLFEDLEKLSIVLFRYVKSNGTDCRFFYIDKYEHGAGSISE